MAEDVLAKRKRLTQEAAGMADEGVTGVAQRLNPMRGVMREMEKIKAKPDPTFDDPTAHGPTAKVPSGGMGGLAPYTPPPTAGRKSFGVDEGD